MKHFSFALTAALAILSCAFAQQNTQTLSGTYVFSEEGSGVTQPMASVAILNFMTGGTVAGTRVWRSPGSSYKSSLQGTYSLNSDGAGALALTATTIPTDGSDPVTVNVNYQLLVSKTRNINAIRTDNGFFTIAQLSPAATIGSLKGAFVFSEQGNGSPYAGLWLLNLDGTNGITGSLRVQTVGVNVACNLTGNYALASDGFGTLTLNIPATDLDGNVSFTPANYIFVAGMNQVFAIRTDATTATISTLTAL